VAGEGPCLLLQGPGQRDRREVLGFDVGDSESGAFWTGFLRALKAAGLHGVQLVISDAHTGLKAAVGSMLLALAGSAHPPTSAVAGSSRWSTSAVGRGPWQRDRWRSSGRPVPSGGGGP
jgi:Transposase, Mutator family